MAQSGKTTNYEIPYAIPTDVFNPSELGDSFTVVDNTIKEVSDSQSGISSIATNALSVATEAKGLAASATETANSASGLATTANTNANEAKSISSTTKQNFDAYIETIRGDFKNPNASAFPSYSIKYTWYKGRKELRIYGGVQNTNGLSGNITLANLSDIPGFPIPSKERSITNAMETNNGVDKYEVPVLRINTQGQLLTPQGTAITGMVNLNLQVNVDHFGWN